MSAPDTAPQAQPNAQAQTELEVVKPENKNDPRYFYLTKPIEVEGRVINHLLLDPSVKNFSGRDLMKIVATYTRRFPDEVRSHIHPIQKYSSENFLGLVVAKLNAITPEDLWQIPYGQLSNLYARAGAFQFSAEGGMQANSEDQ